LVQAFLNKWWVESDFNWWHSQSMNMFYQ
jgi:hypothetical protein